MTPPQDTHDPVIELTVDERKLVRRVLIRTALAIVFFITAMGLVGLLVKDEVIALSQGFVNEFGAWGVALGFFLPDSLAVPLPHEIFLAFGLLGDLDFYTIAVFASVGSLLGGVCGFLAARVVGHTKRFKRFMAGRGRVAHYLVERHGAKALAASALTPLPYSVFAWICGALGMRFTRFFVVSQLRIVRVVFYLWLVQLGVINLM